MKVKENIYREVNSNKIVGRALYTLQGKLLEAQDFGDGISQKEFERRFRGKVQESQTHNVRVSVNEVGYPNERVEINRKAYGVPDPPRPRWTADGKPDFDDPIGRVKEYFVSEFGEEEGVKMVRRMDGITLLKINDGLKKGILKSKPGGAKKGTGAPVPPKPKWTADGRPDGRIWKK